MNKKIKSYSVEISNNRRLLFILKLIVFKKMYPF